MSNTGMIANWNFAKGYGFIRPTTGGADVFCHRRELRMLAKDHFVNMQVKFDIGAGAEGRVEAKNVDAAR